MPNMERGRGRTVDQGEKLPGKVEGRGRGSIQEVDKARKAVGGMVGEVVSLEVYFWQISSQCFHQKPSL